MLDGHPMRSFAILALLLVAPLASAATPGADRASADGMDGQEITDMSADPTGQFVAAVVAFDAAKGSTPVLPGLGGGGGSSSSRKDVYMCDYGPSAPPRTITGCRGVRHVLGALETPTPNAPQRVATTTVDTDGRRGVYAVAGPDGKVSLWSHHSDTALWSTAVQNGNQALNVTLSRDATRVVVGAAPTSPTAGGSIEVRFGNNGTLAWAYSLQEATGSPSVRPASLAYARSGTVLAIGTNSGVYFANPSADRPTGVLGGITQAESVSKVVLSGDGQYVAAASSRGVFFAKLVSGAKPSVTSNASIFNSAFSTAAQDVALTTDGTRFAAAAGSQIHFFRRTDEASGVLPVGDAYDAGERIASVDYDEKGDLLVAVAGNRVIGFGPGRNTPLWSFDATQAAFGALDGPLRHVSVSDDAQRIIVAGRTKTMAYTNVVSVTANLTPIAGTSTIQPTQTAALALNVKNTGSLSDNYSFVITTPVGWPAASADVIRLAPEENATVVFNVTAPVGQAPGVYGVQVRLRSQISDELAQRRGQAVSYLNGPSFNFTILRSVVLKVEAPDERLLLRQGSEQTIPVTLRNEGNAEGVVNLSTRQELTRGASWDVRFEGGDQVRVPASGSVTVKMIVTAPSDAGSGERNTITIRAREGDTVEATDQVTAYMDAQFGAELRTNKSTWEFFPGQVQVLRVNVTNIGNTDDVYNLTSAVTPATFATDWRVTIETPQVTVQRGSTKGVAVTVKAVASDAREASLTLRAESQGSPDRQENSLILNLLTVPRPPTQDPDDNKLVPAPAPALLLAALAAVLVARRALGGRR